jgi:hypothetical protein
MEDDLNIFPNGRRPKLFGKMKDDLNPKEMEDHPAFLANGS